MSSKNATNPNPKAPETLRPSQLTIVPPADDGENLTPESVLARVESELTKLGGMWAKGPKAWNLKVAGQRLHNALAEVKAAEAHAASLRAQMATLIKEGIAAINGQALPKKSKATATSTTGTTGTTTK